MSKFVIKANNGKYFNHQDYLFVHHSKGSKYKTLAEAQQAFDEMLAKQPSLSELAPQIIPIEKQARLTHAEFLYLRNTLTKAQFDVYLYLLTLNPFSDRPIEIDTAVISEHLGFARRTIQVSLGKLSSHGLINWEVTKSKVMVFSPKNKNPDHKNNNDAAKFENKNDVVQDRQGVVQDRQGVVQDRQGVVQDRQGVVQDRQRDSKPSLDNGSESSQTIKTISNSLKLSQTTCARIREEKLENLDQENSDREIPQVENLDQENSEKEILREEVLQKTETPVVTNSENAESGKQAIKKPIPRERQAQQEDLHKENSNREATSNIQNLDEGQTFAAAPRFFANLSEFVIHEAKQDPAIKSPKIWANTCLKRNPEEWQAKWDAWEKSRAVTTTYKPEEFVPPDPEIARKAMEEAKKLLPEWMRRNG